MLIKRGFEQYGADLNIALRYADDGEQALDATT